MVNRKKNLGRILQQLKVPDAIVGTKARLPSASFGHIADAVAASLEHSLMRLRRDRVDIFHLHNAITEAGGGETLRIMEDAMGRRPGYCIHRRCEPMELPMQTLNDLSRSLIGLEPAGTLIAVIEMSLSSWLVAGIVPGIERQPLKKLAVDESALLRLLHR